MNLKQEINRTEAEKNKTKQVAINIDNKLVELGGEQATDLADVPNKMGAMVTEQYRKVAFIDIPQGIEIPNIYNGVAPFTRTINYNISFTPKIVVFGGTDYMSDDINNKEQAFIFTARQNISGQDWLGHPFTRKYHVSNPINLRITSITNKQIQFESLGTDGYIRKLMLIG